MKRLLVLLFMLALLLPGARAMAATHTGTISAYHLNSQVAGRGVCVRTVPTMPNTWACLWRSNPLYQEITDLLRFSFLQNKTCTIQWSSPDPHGWNLINLVECYP